MKEEGEEEERQNDSRTLIQSSQETYLNHKTEGEKKSVMEGEEERMRRTG